MKKSISRIFNNIFMNNVDFSYGDFNIWKIKKELGLSKLKTKNTYRVYGIYEAEDNPPIEISYNFNKFFNKGESKSLTNFFKQRKIDLKIDNNKYTEIIHIGLRKDLRCHISLCAASIKIIILYLENKIELDNNCNLGIPKFY